ncbi:MAG: PA2779 family protein [Gallionella sp.]
MKTLQGLTKPASLTVFAGMLAMSLQLPVANAAIVDTDATINNGPEQQQTERNQDTLNREAVKAKLLSLGVEPIQVQARVDALTVNETQMLSQHLDQLPAGGGAVSILLIILLLLLIL